MDITQKIINMDQLLEHNIQSARRRYKNISRIAYEQVQLLIKRDQQDRNVLIDTEMKKIVEVSQQYSIPVDIMKLKESILQLVRKK